MTEINFLVENVDMPPINRLALQNWIVEVARTFNKNVGRLSYIFCDDEYILKTNRQFLGHDYFTDIITFDYSNRQRIAGDMVISLAKQFDSSRGGVPLACRLCDLIEGWIIAIQQMHIGDKWEIYIPAEMGYGKFSQPGIPGGSTLIFEIELLGIA